MAGFLLYRYRVALKLQNAQRVFDDQAEVVVVCAVLIILNAVGTPDSATQAEGEILSGAFLDDVLSFEVELVLFALFANTGIDIVAIDITSHEAQARNTILGHVQVIANLPGALVLAVEVGVLNGVGSPDGTTAVDAVGVSRITGGTLVCNGERMGAQGVGCCQAPEFVIDFARQLTTVIVSFIGIEVEIQRLIFCQRQIVVQVDVFLFRWSSTSEA